jgi:hypothetical protein
MKSQRRDRRLLLLRPLGRELPDISGRQEVHHRFITLFHGEQLRDLHVSASARSPSRCFPHLFPERSLLVFPSVAVAEEVFPRLGRRPASAAAPHLMCSYLWNPLIFVPVDTMNCAFISSRMETIPTPVTIIRTVPRTSKDREIHNTKYRYDVT